ncbi:MAG: hypothetical protein R3C12_17685 [Planctomycetaceae bacterium]
MKSLIKQHGKNFYEPIGKALQKAGIKHPNPMNPASGGVEAGGDALCEVAGGGIAGLAQAGGIRFSPPVCRDMPTSRWNNYRARESSWIA